MPFNEYFKVGYISKTHGLRGEVTALIEAEVALDEDASLFLDKNGTLVPYFVEKISGTTGKPFIKFEGVQSIEEASLLKGCSIYMLKSARAKLKRGEFYDDEIIGFEVRDNSLGLLGEVHEIQNQGANRLLSILGKGKEVLIPIQGPFITSINKSKRLILVELPEGFLDI